MPVIKNFSENDMPVIYEVEDEPIWKLGPDLKEGDVIKFWPTGDRGMRIEKLMTYTGRYPDIVCSVAYLRGTKHDGKGVAIEAAIEHTMMYEIIGDPPCTSRD